MQSVVFQDSQQQQQPIEQNSPDVTEVAEGQVLN
jgi:hypothetical protein